MSPDKPNKNEKKDKKMKHRSWEVTDGPERAPHRSMFRAMGLNDKDLSGLVNQDGNPTSGATLVFGISKTFELN